MESARIKNMAFAACVSLAWAFIFSCSSDGDGQFRESSSSGGGSSSSIQSKSSSSSAASSSSSVQCSNAGNGTFTDIRDGEEYGYVTICSQTWMAKNLNYAVSGSKCGNKDSNLFTEDDADCEIYGRLYDWATAMGFEQNCNESYCASQIDTPHQGVCPDGWHLPSDAEWTQLTDFAGINAGQKLKATSGWNGNGNGTDDYGFSALPGGFCYSDGSFYDAGFSGSWWGASEGWEYAAYGLYMNYYDRNVNGSSNGVKSGSRSVRCVRD